MKFSYLFFVNLRKKHSKFAMLKLSCCKNSYFPRVMFKSVSSNSAINDANTKKMFVHSVLRIGALDKLCIFFCKSFPIVILMHWNFLVFFRLLFWCIKIPREKNYVTWKVTVLRHCIFTSFLCHWHIICLPLCWLNWLLHFS